MNSGLRCSAREDHLAELARDRMVLRQLQVVLDARRLMAGGDAAVDPVGARRAGWRACADLLGGEDVGNLQISIEPAPLRSSTFDVDASPTAGCPGCSGRRCC